MKARLYTALAAVLVITPTACSYAAGPECDEETVMRGVIQSERYQQLKAQTKSDQEAIDLWMAMTADVLDFNGCRNKEGRRYGAAGNVPPAQPQQPQMTCEEKVLANARASIQQRVAALDQKFNALSDWDKFWQRRAYLMARTDALDGIMALPRLTATMCPGHTFPQPAPQINVEVPAPSYSRPSINCTSNTIGNYTYTNCN
jgi:hypothetical protein